MRRGERAGQISERTARTALGALLEMMTTAIRTSGRAVALAWDLRGTITFYDALSAALATVSDVPLLTANTRLSNAAGLSGRVMLIS